MQLTNTIHVGWAGLFSPTPTQVKWVYRAFGLGTLLWTTLLGFYGAQIPVTIQLNVFKALSCGTALTYTAAQFFGITLPDNPQSIVKTPTPSQVVTPVSSFVIKPNE